MKKDFWLGTLVSLWLLSLSGMASPLEDKVNALRAAIKADGSTTNPQPTPSAFPDRPAAVMSEAAADEVLNRIASGQMNQLPGDSTEMLINQILLTHPSGAVQKAAHALLEEIEAERKAKADAYASEITGVLKRLADVISKATKPSDLDEILVKLQKYQNAGYPGYSPSNEDQQRLFQQAAMAYQFATGWQDYLSDSANGNIEQARNELRSLAQNSYGITIVPRSHILELMNAPISIPAPAVNSNQGAPPTPRPTVDDILSQVKTLDQMEGALKQIDALNSSPGSVDIGTIDTLQNYVEAYHDIKAGLPTNINFSGGLQSLRGHEDITRKMWLLALQALFPSFKGAPSPDEKPLDFVNRVIADAASREDWNLLKKALEMKSSVTLGMQTTIYFPDSTSGLNSLISALNQEAAGQFSLAVVSYEVALKSPSLDIPAKIIGEKLAAIKKDHPSEFETGYAQAFSPAMGPYGIMQRYPYPRGGYPYPYPGRAPSNILSIPGRNNSSATSNGVATKPVLTPPAPMTNSTTPPPPPGQ